MKKRELNLLLLILLIFSFPLISADENLDKAKECLQNNIKSNTELTLEEALFAKLGLGNSKLLNDIIEKNKDSSYCWPKGGCKLKESALVLLSKQEQGESDTKLIEWLKLKEKESNDLIWYLQIDVGANEESSCEISIGETSSTIRIKKDMTLEGSPGSCFDIASGKYWLSVKPSCYNKEFEISCDKDFTTNLLYQKKDSSTVYVSSTTNSAPSLGTTKEKINVKCLGTSDSCDYEGTLWATFALQYSGEDVSTYIPYLVAMSENNKQYFPSALLYIILRTEGWDGNEHFGNLITTQKTGGYWEIVGTKYNRFYDSSLAFLALKGSGDGAVDKGKAYFIKIQEEKGCWDNNNIRSTGFLIYAIWGEPFNDGGGSSSTGIPIENVLIEGDRIDEDGDGVDDGIDIDGDGKIDYWFVYTDDIKYVHGLDDDNDGLVDIQDINADSYIDEEDIRGTADCESAGNSCGSRLTCINEGGNILSDFSCDAYGDICCDADIGKESCIDLFGTICETDETCLGEIESSQEGACCIGECILDEESSSCELIGDGICKNSCSDGEEEIDYSCSGSDVCCTEIGSKPNEEPTESNLWIWLIVLGILILLVVLGIVYRDKLRVWISQLKYKKKKDEGRNNPFGTVRPMFPPPSRGGNMTIGRPVLTRPSSRPAQTRNDRDMDDTMRKLKEMSG
jgi:hypothetical protein